MVTALSVNLNAIAMLRNRRSLPWPNILHFADIALRAGAKGITVHPRPDQRHIRFSDIADIAAFLKKNYPEAEFNIEGYPTSEFLELALPYAQQITLVPDKPEQKTSDHGWDFLEAGAFLKPIVETIQQKGIRVSVFANPSPIGLEEAKNLGVNRVEFYTGPYGLAFYHGNYHQQLVALKIAAEHAKALELEINAGHDLTVENLAPLKKEVPFLAEVSIGHALTIDALEHGMAQTVKRFLNILNS